MISGVQGFLVHMDENGDAEGNYTVLSRMPFNSTFGNFSMLPVGQFQIGANNTLPVSTSRALFPYS